MRLQVKQRSRASSGTAPWAMARSQGRVNRERSRSRSAPVVEQSFRPPSEVLIPPGLFVSVSWNLQSSFQVLQRSDGGEKMGPHHQGPLLLLEEYAHREHVWLPESECQRRSLVIPSVEGDRDWYRACADQSTPLRVHQHRRGWLEWFMRVGRALPASSHGVFWSHTEHFGNCGRTCSCCRAISNNSLGCHICRGTHSSEH